MKFLYSKAIIISVSVLLPALAFSQTSSNGSNYATAIPTAVPFLNITPDSRSGALGDAGVALTPDVNANFWNPAKLAYLENNDNVSLSYSPWLRQLVPDISLSYLSYAHKVDDRNTIGASLRYFNYGSIQLTDPNQNNQGTYTPSEFSLNGSFARKFGENFSLGLTVGFIHSSLSNAYFATGSGQQAKAGNALSAGVSLYYNKPMQEFGTDGILSFGTNISNIGSKISYSDAGPKYFLPANLKIGFANTLNLDDY
ncbi:MAG: type IX secretion system outer membrane channel protein PorV, partial [Mucilaginibacter sp.]